MTKLSDQRLLSILRSEGPQSPATLTSRLRLSQPTLFRSAQAQPQTVIALGARRNRKLAALRDVRNLGPHFPVFLISGEGELVPLGEIVALYPSSFVFINAKFPTLPKYFPGLPFFLDDARPQGFLGKAFSQQNPDLDLPLRLSDWNNDDILQALATRGEDLVGNLLVGTKSFERYQILRYREAEKSEDAIDARNPASAYLRCAQAAMEGEPAGSSAGGEHPKFGATLLGENGAIQKVLVKFSPAGDSFAATRWRDLLICEALSLEVLAEQGIAATPGRIIEAGGRVFLETLRFDRQGLHGRKGVLSLAAAENEWIGRGANWAVSGRELERQNKISTQDLEKIRLLECFGRLIANSDRHAGNLSFFWSPEEPVASLAPVYDMLPMLFAPTSRGEDSGKNFVLPTFEPSLLNALKTALPLALRYWERVIEDSRISEGFRTIARGVRGRLE